RVNFQSQAASHIQSVGVAGGVLLVLTEREYIGFTRRDSKHFERVVAEAFDRLRSIPDDLHAGSRLVTALFALHQREAAIEIAGRLLQSRKAVSDPLGASMLSGLIEAAAETEADLNPPQAYAHRFTKKPAVDGRLEESYRQHEGFRLESLKHVFRIQREELTGLDWKGKEDLSAKLYFGWDNEKFYFALDVSDSHLRPHDREADTWQGDLLFIMFDFLNDDSARFSRDDTLLHLGFMKPRKREQTEAEKKREEENRPDGEYMIRRKEEDDSGAVYECAIPWVMFYEHMYGENEELWPSLKPPYDGFRFGFNLALTDDDSIEIVQRKKKQPGEGKKPPDEENKEELETTTDKGPGATKIIMWTPGLLMEHEMGYLFNGFMPNRFGTVTLKDKTVRPEPEEGKELDPTVEPKKDVQEIEKPKEK
ncbi:MAG: sugar-binding protein, partial [Planctomycetota bacterium]